MLRVLKGERPERPQGHAIPDDIWVLIGCCWLERPSDRPTADEAVQALEEITEVSDAGELPDWSEVPRMQAYLRQSSSFVPSLDDIQRSIQHLNSKPKHTEGDLQGM